MDNNEERFNINDIDEKSGDIIPQVLNNERIEKEGLAKEKLPESVESVSKNIEKIFEIENLFIKEKQIYFPLKNLDSIERRLEEEWRDLNSRNPNQNQLDQFDNYYKKTISEAFENNLQTIKKIVKVFPFLGNFTKYLDQDNPDNWIEYAPNKINSIKIDLDIDKIKEVIPQNEFYGSMSFGSREEGTEYGVLYENETKEKDFTLLNSEWHMEFGGEAAKNFYTAQRDYLPKISEGEEHDGKMVDYDENINISVLPPAMIGQQLQSFRAPIAVFEFKYYMCQWENNDFMKLTIYPFKDIKNIKNNLLNYEIVENDEGFLKKIEKNKTIPISGDRYNNIDLNKFGDWYIQGSYVILRLLNKSLEKAGDIDLKILKNTKIPDIETMNKKISLEERDNLKISYSNPLDGYFNLDRYFLTPKGIVCPEDYPDIPNEIDILEDVSDLPPLGVLRAFRHKVRYELPFSKKAHEVLRNLKFDSAALIKALEYQRNSWTEEECLKIEKEIKEFYNL